MKAIWVTVDELALALNLSVKSIRRAYQKGEIPIVRIGRLVRFDVEDVKKTMERDKHEAFRRHIAEALARRTPGGASRRRAQPQRPRLVTRGRYPQRSLQEVQGFDEFCLHPHHRLAGLYVARKLSPGNGSDPGQRME